MTRVVAIRAPIPVVATTRDSVDRSVGRAPRASASSAFALACAMAMMTMTTAPCAATTTDDDPIEPFSVYGAVEKSFSVNVMDEAGRRSSDGGEG